jgi:phosphoglycolate phosphatase
VATGKSRRGLNNALNKTNLNAFFSFTRTMDECFSKPHPQMINQILENLFIEPERSIMVGDSIYDLEMARNASIDSIAVTYGSQTHDELNHYPTKALIDNPHDLFDWLRVYG